MKHTKITVRVAHSTRGGENNVASPVTPCGRATLSAAASVGASAQSAEVATGNPRPTGEGKGVVGTPRTVKPGEKIVVEAMRAEGLERLENELERLREQVKRMQRKIDGLKLIICKKDDQIAALRIFCIQEDEIGKLRDMLDTVASMNDEEPEVEP